MHRHAASAHECDHPTQARPPVGPAVATAICAVAGLAGWAAGDSRLALAAWLVAYLAGGAGPLRHAVESLAQRQLNVDLLMIVAAIGAAALDDWAEGTALLFLFSLSGTLEEFATYKTKRSIAALTKLRPREALLVCDGEPDRSTLIEDLQLGDVVRIRPGERFPIDGEVIEGELWADESTLTGESQPVHRPVGGPVFAGAINLRGSGLVRMTKAVADTTLERIIRLVQEAQAEKTPTQRFVESWQRPYVIGVFAAAAFAFAAAYFMHDRSLHEACYHSMVLLVAASPCAVVVSAPSAMLSAIARAGLHGVLFKGGASLENLGRVDVMAFDKTGTLTRGRPAVTEVWTRPGVDADRLLRLAAIVEQRSEHHLGEPVVAEALRRGLATGQPLIEEFDSHTGWGVHARVDGVWVGVGREPLFESHAVGLPAAVLEAAQQIRGAGQTALLVITDEEGLAGVVAVADQPRHDAAETIAALKRLGIRKTVILTGDHLRVAQAIATELGADEVRAGLLPDQKVLELRRLRDEGGTVAMVGDGVNDSPALAAASVGIAMGGAGTDVALEAADVVLMSDDLATLPFAIWLGRRTLLRTRQNVTIAAGMIALLVLSSFFSLPLWLTVLGHEGSTLIVVLNGLRLLWEKAPATVSRPA